MKPCAIAFSLLLGLTAALAKDRQRHCVFRLHAEADPRDTQASASSVPAKLSGKDISLERVARVSEEDVAAFYPYRAADGTFGALLQLDAHGRITLDALSAERLGHLLFVFVNGRHITELEIDKRVSDGKVYIPSGLNEVDIALMKKDWRLIGQKKKR